MNQTSKYNNNLNVMIDRFLAEDHAAFLKGET